MNVTLKLLTAATLVFGLCNCKTENVADAHTAQFTLDWAGVYKATVPAASAPGIEKSITLNEDQTYKLTYLYIDRLDEPFDFFGHFTWEPDGITIKLDTQLYPPYYVVQEDQLVQLDMSGNPITGDLATNYILKKQ